MSDATPSQPMLEASSPSSSNANTSMLSTDSVKVKASDQSSSNQQTTPHIKHEIKQEMTPVKLEVNHTSSASTSSITSTLPPLPATHHAVPLTINPTLINSTSALSISTPTLMTNSSTPLINTDEQQTPATNNVTNSSSSHLVGTSLVTPHSLSTPLSTLTSLPETPSTTLDSINSQTFSPKAISTWTAEEDELLRQAMQQNPSKNFKKIGKSSFLVLC